MRTRRLVATLRQPDPLQLWTWLLQLAYQLLVAGLRPLSAKKEGLRL